MLTLQNNFIVLKLTLDKSKVIARYNNVEEAAISNKYASSSILKAISSGNPLGNHTYIIQGNSEENSEKDFTKVFSVVGNSKKSFKVFKGDPSNVLVIGDTHLPFVRDGYLEFCRETQEKFNCGTIVHIGDVLDNHFSSFHETNPDGKSAIDELTLARNLIKEWEAVFPEVKVCIGNHDALPNRKAFSSGLSKHWIKSFSEVLNVPGWDFQMCHEIHGVLYIHGTGSSGEKAALNRAMNMRKSVVQGHIHTVAGTQWNVSEIDKIFGMQVGCGMDDKSYAAEYAKFNIKKSIVSCGVVLNNGKLPIVIPMEL